MDTAQKLKLDEIRQAVQQLRLIHYTLRHQHIPGCAECISLAWLEKNGF